MKEFRTLKASELRSETDADGKQYLVGYAARYNVLSRDLGWFESIYERIKPGAFTRAIRELQDVYHLVNHDPSQILGRTLAGTTELTEDDRGLKFRTLINASDPAAVAFAARVARGDIDQCSFGFQAREVQWTEEKDGKDATTIRELLDVDLFDVSTVTYPAYPQTSTSVASMSMRSLLRVDGDKIPAALRTRIEAQPSYRLVKEKRDPEDQEMEYCSCQCASCLDGDCEDCINEDCVDMNCRCGMRSRPPKAADGRKMKRVDGELLTSDCFLVVGDENNSKTWKLAVKLSTKEKTITHIRNALVRFNDLHVAAQDTWLKLIALTKEFGIDVGDDQNKHIRTRLTDKQVAELTFNAELETARALAEALALQSSL
jgi:uncharacterized protein